MIARLLVALAIALLCATPAAACAISTIDDPDAPCLIDDAIATVAPVPPATPRLVAMRPTSAVAHRAADPGRARVFRPPRA